jgi:hypothetical protein
MFADFYNYSLGCNNNPNTIPWVLLFALTLLSSHQPNAIPSKVQRINRLNGFGFVCVR